MHSLTFYLKNKPSESAAYQKMFSKTLSYDIGCINYLKTTDATIHMNMQFRIRDIAKKTTNCSCNFVKNPQKQKTLNIATLNL